MSEATDPSSISTHPRIVVGTDGSEGSIAAIRWALTQADVTGADLEVIVAWDFDAKSARRFDPAWAMDAEHLSSDARTIGENALAAALDGRSRPDRVRVETVQGPAALALVERSRGAVLLVVGARGRGGFANLLLGSVSAACVRHATCPVLVVPSEGRGV